ncbi:MAG: hypothetical protein IGS39_18635 [Calothrix sp. C42_A2020_038]|nr:hypothetical protein [Calothrix sp. C42_A2020_038]
MGTVSSLDHSGGRDIFLEVLVKMFNVKLINYKSQNSNSGIPQFRDIPTLYKALYYGYPDKGK